MFKPMENLQELLLISHKSHRSWCLSWELLNLESPGSIIRIIIISIWCLYRTMCISDGVVFILYSLRVISTWDLKKMLPKNIHLILKIKWAGLIKPLISRWWTILKTLLTILDQGKKRKQKLIDFCSIYLLII